MTGTFTILTFSLWLAWILYRDTQDRPTVSPSVWIVFAWLVIHGTRPATIWLGWESEYSRDEGNPAEAAINIVVILAGVITLLRRTVRWQDVIKYNIWILIFYLFWSISITWSDYPLITVKRLFKELGNIVMVLLILTDKEPGQAVRAACVRFAYVSVPLSVVLIKYFPEWGRTFVGYHGDVQMYTGVTTHKNLLGVLVFVSVLFVLLDLIEHRINKREFVYNSLQFSRAMVFGMCWYLLFIIDSVTSLVCAVIGCATLMVLRLPAFRKKPGRFEIILYGSAVLFWVVDLVFDVRERIIVDGFGRNMTLTSRSDIWMLVQEFQDQPLVGQGFDTFWAGQRMTLLAEKTAGIIQAHNGYLETYLNGGWVGVGLLIVLLLTGYWQARKALVVGRTEDHVRFVLLLTALIHNYTEASFNKVGVLWFVTVFAIINYKVPVLRSQVKHAKQAYAYPVSQLNLPDLPRPDLPSIERSLNP